MKPWILIGALALLGTIICLLREVRDTGSPATAPPVAAAASREAAPGVRGAMAAPQPRPALAVGHPSASSGDDKPDERPGPESPSGDEVRDHLETSFAGEPATAASQDRAYAVEQGVRAALPAGSLLRSVQCRGAICRVETAHASIEDFRDFIHRAFQTPDSPIAHGPVFAGPLASATPGEPLVAVAYLGREGSMLPMPPSVVMAARPR